MHIEKSDTKSIPYLKDEKAQNNAIIINGIIINRLFKTENFFMFF